ncbi:MAG: DnaT-like ssDNA-binding protein [Cucumibacter sp.]
MALDVTSGSATADSYASLAEAAAYFTARGIATWTGTDDVKESALRRATAYLDNQYRDKWRGVRVNETQSLAWPRVDAGGYPLYDLDGFSIPTDAIPIQVRSATLEAALLTLTGVSLEPRLARGGKIKSIGKRVGPLGTDITYMDGAPVVDRITVIEGLLRGLITTSSMVRLVRS